MLDAVQNHSARVVVVDELQDAKEVEAARTMVRLGCAFHMMATSTLLG